MAKLITIATENYSRAQILKAKLESEGIKCVLSNMNLVQSSVSSGVQVKVSEGDLKKAIKIFLSVKGTFLRSGLKRKPRVRVFRKILVPVDFSENSFHTAVFALQIAQSYNAQLHFLNVYYVPALDMVTAPEVNFSQFSLDTVMVELKIKANDQMKAFLKRLRTYANAHNLSDVKMRSSVIEGITDDIILQYVKKKKINSIILGTQGEGNKPDNFLGNTVWSIIQKSSVPVIAVPRNFSLEPNKKTYNVMLTTDLDEGVFVTVRKLISILRPFNNIKLFCVHASNKPVNEYQKAKMDELKGYISTVSDFDLVFDFIETDDYIKAFNDFVVKNKIDLMCMSSRKRGIIERFFNPSLAKKMIYHSYAPLLVVHI